MDSSSSVFIVTSTGGAGLTKSQARQPRFIAPSRGVRFQADEPDRLGALARAALITRSDISVLCDVSAAQHWGLPLPPWIGLELERRPVGVAVARGGSRQRRIGVRGRRLELPDDHLVTDRDRSVTIPPRTWVDCAELLAVEHLVVMGDVILRRTLASAAELDSMVRWARGRRGVRIARSALTLLDAGAESPGESLARCALLMAGVPRPTCNADIVIDGEWFARADMAWLPERVIVEYDGIVHLPEEHRRKDALRRNLLQERGWIVIVFTAADLKHPDRMAHLVTSALNRH